MKRNIHPAAALYATVLACGLGLPAYAQMAGGGLNPANPIGATPRLHSAPEEQPPPPALPGGSGIGSDTPSQVQIDNEDPTKVLFSAINDGNYAEARAAISRGASLNAPNVLGETPIEMSVALNRNNITFMLLSMRAADNAGNAGAVSAAPVVTVGNSITARTKSPTHRTIRPRTARQAPAQPPGVPNPAAGFLGFNGAS